MLEGRLLAGQLPREPTDDAAVDAASALQPGAAVCCGGGACLAVRSMHTPLLVEEPAKGRGL